MRVFPVKGCKSPRDSRQKDRHLKPLHLVLGAATASTWLGEEATRAAFGLFCFCGPPLALCAGLERLKQMKLNKAARHDEASSLGDWKFRLARG